MDLPALALGVSLIELSPLLFGQLSGPRLSAYSTGIARRFERLA
jgi:hypothetical protein